MSEAASQELTAMQTPNFDLAGRSALITGAARGIGLAIAQTLAHYGCAIALQDIDLEAAQREVDAMHAATNVQVKAIGGDISKPTDYEQIVPQAIDALAKIDILINNAAVQMVVPYLEATAEHWRWQFEGNVIAANVISQQTLPGMTQRNWGRIVNIGSIQGARGNPTMSGYAVSKAALWNLTQAQARQFTRQGVTVNMISPGWFDTLRNAEGIEQSRESARRVIPVGRMGLPNDCTGTALLLCSEAGSFISGQDITISGGI